MPTEPGKRPERVEGPQGQRITVALASGKVVSRLIPRDLPCALLFPGMTITIEPR